VLPSATANGGSDVNETAAFQAYGPSGLKAVVPVAPEMVDVIGEWIEDKNVLHSHFEIERRANHEILLTRTLTDHIDHRLGDECDQVAQFGLSAEDRQIWPPEGIIRKANTDVHRLKAATTGIRFGVGPYALRDIQNTTLVIVVRLELPKRLPTDHFQPDPVFGRFFILS